MIEVIFPRWAGERCIVAATGPSLTKEVSDQCRAAHEAGTHKIVAVNDAYRILPFADVLYACDAAWWDVHKGCPGFRGEKWSSHGKSGGAVSHCLNDKIATAEKYGLRLVRGKTAEGFSLDPSVIHYGNNSGFQGINLAILFGATRIPLVGFDMHAKNGRHFFGDHPRPLKNAASFDSWVPTFARAAKMLPSGIDIVNCTPGSALKCFPMVNLSDEMRCVDRCVA